MLILISSVSVFETSLILIKSLMNLEITNEKLEEIRINF